jgi:esterase/lipase superfamily enzyme
MRRHQLELPLGSGIDRPMTVISYGHYGRPVLVFPSEAGRTWDFENNDMVDAVAGLLDDGRIKLYCVDSLDADTWSDKGLPIEERALRHEVYTRGSPTPWSLSSMPTPRPAPN